MLKRSIPATGEQLPVIGLGTWQTFDVEAPQALAPLAGVLQHMRQAGARLIDSSPMYGRAESTIGKLTGGEEKDFFYATKVWTTGKQAGIRQMEESFHKMQRRQMDLIQIHNLLDWKTQLQTLRDWKTEGKVRYLGITHYTDGMHGELEKLLRSEKLDFVQFNYSIFARHAEKSLLNTAAELGVAILINRPFGEGSAFLKIKNTLLPAWAADQGIVSWSQFFLRYILSHPAVTVIIPATGNPAHAQDNFNITDFEPLPPAFKNRMVDFISRL